MATLPDHPGEEAGTVQGRPDDLHGRQAVGFREVGVGGPGAGQLTGVRPGDLAGEPMPDGVWFYNGSQFDGGGFIAQQEGSIIALSRDGAALGQERGSAG